MTWTIMIHRISIERLRGDQIHGTIATVAIQMISFPVQLASPPLSLSSELTLKDLVRFSVLTENGHHFLFVRKLLVSTTESVLSCLSAPSNTNIAASSGPPCAFPVACEISPASVCACACVWSQDRIHGPNMTRQRSTWLSFTWPFRDSWPLVPPDPRTHRTVPAVSPGSGQIWCTGLQVRFGTRAEAVQKILLHCNIHLPVFSSSSTL
jgi:hypothetical protein